MKTLLNFINWFLGFLLVLSFGILVYTAEYTGINGKPGPIKQFLDQEFSFSLSLLLILLIFLILILIINNTLMYFLGVKKQLKVKIQELQNSNTELKKQLERTRNDNDELKKQTTVDISQLDKFFSLLPQTDMLRYTKDSDLGNKIEVSFIEMINIYQRAVDDPTFTFFDKVIEENKKYIATKFKELVEIFIHYGNKIEGTNNVRLDKEIKYSNSQLYSSLINDCNQIAHDAWEAYKLIINHSRQKYGYTIA